VNTKQLNLLCSRLIRTFDCVQDTPARQNQNKFCFALDLSVSLTASKILPLGKIKINFVLLSTYPYLCKLKDTTMTQLSRISATIILCTTAICAQALDFNGLPYKAIELSPEAQTGLETVYVLQSTENVAVSYPSPKAKWSIFGAAGGAYAEEITAVNVYGQSSGITLEAGDCGIIVEDAGRQHCYWIVDYSRHEFTINGVNATDGDYACDNVMLGIDGNGDAIHYYSINGRELTLDRDIAVSYTTLIYDEEAKQYIQAEYTSSLPYISAASHVPAPLCDTRFSIEGDRFLRAWGKEQSATSGEYHAVAVDARTEAGQTERDAENEQNPGTSGLGGSAPCEITFSAETTDAAVYKEWQISRNSDFDVLENNFNTNSFTNTFTENGTLYVRFTAANADGSCEYIGDVYEISIGESKLLCPNAFTPHTSPGVNDEWRVSYQSIIEFKCDIFTRWGKKVITLTEPSQGWDGTYGGKKAAPGVYYYVIRARGADGKEYKMSGDINIIGTRETGTGTTSAE